MQTEFSRGDDDDLSYTRLFHHADITTLIHSFQPNLAHHLPVATTAAPTRFTSALRITMPAARTSILAWSPRPSRPILIRPPWSARSSLCAPFPFRIRWRCGHHHDPCTAHPTAMRVSRLDFVQNRSHPSTVLLQESGKHTERMEPAVTADAAHWLDDCWWLGPALSIMAEMGSSVNFVWMWGYYGHRTSPAGSVYRSS